MGPYYEGTMVLRWHLTDLYGFGEARETRGGHSASNEGRQLVRHADDEAPSIQERSSNPAHDFNGGASAAALAGRHRIQPVGGKACPSRKESARRHSG